MSEKTEPHLRKLLAMSHWDWWDLSHLIHRKLELEAVPVSKEFQIPEPEGESEIQDPHLDLAGELDKLSDQQVMAEWESWLAESPPWLPDAILRTDRLPREYDARTANASGSFRLKLAIPFTLLRMKSPSVELASRVLRLGICEEDPSTNRDFIEPALRLLGMQKVLEIYWSAFKIGNADLRAGVANAMYWTRHDPVGVSGPEHPQDNPDRIQELRAALGAGFIDAFLAAEEPRDLHFMRCCFSKIDRFLPPGPSGRDRYEQCRRKAAASADPYLQNRAQAPERKGGGPPPLMALPHRPKQAPSTKPWWKLW